MRFKKLIMLSSTVAIAGAAAGVGLSASMATGAATFQTTSAGLSYGSVQETTIEAGPDLIQAYGDDGKTLGYLLKSDLLAPDRTPAAALAYEQKLASGGASARASLSRVIPLLDLAGNQIGTFTIEPGVIVEK